MALILPPGYASRLSVRDTERAIPFVRDNFQRFLATNLVLDRASAPPFLQAGTGLNDDLNGTERKVTFTPKGNGMVLEVPNSLAKWKRWALGAYGFKPGEGLWTNMNAIRPDEELGTMHSLYVDQWDWERVITAKERTPEFLTLVVDRIYQAIRQIAEQTRQNYGVETPLPNLIHFVTTEELETRYPTLTRKEREDAVAKEHGAVFIMKIGWDLKDGKPHDGRAPDYDDWNLNGDIVVWNPVLQRAFELSSMGIRVDRDSMINQLTKADAMDRARLMFHKMILEGELPLSVGGGIGQSRLCMLLLGKAHIGEVQASVWPPEMVAQLRESGIHLL